MKTTIKINNIWSHIHSPSNRVLRQINEWERKLTGPYGITHTNGDIMSGVIPLLFDIATEANVIDDRMIPCIADQIPDFVDRDYQRETVRKALAYHRGLLKLPTGSGKSIIIAGLAKALQCTHLILVHKATLVEDLAKTLNYYLKENIGRIHGTADDHNHRVVCATYQSLHSRRELLKWIQERQSVVVDECHALPAITHFAVMLNTHSAYYRFGLSATPLIREDERDIHTIALLGPIIHEVSNQELVEKGYVVPPEVIWLDSVTKTEQSSYGEGYKEAVVNNVFRNQAIKQIMDFCEKPAIIFVKMHAHQHVLFDMLIEVHKRALDVVNEFDPTQRRQKVVERMKSGETTVVIATSVFNEGMDVPNLRTVLNATGAQSWIASIQEPGRGSRPFQDKKTFKLYDFNDQGNDWFEEHTRQRYAAYKEAGYVVKAPTRRAKVIDIDQDQYKIAEPRKRPKFNWGLLLLSAIGLIWFIAYVFSD